MTITVRAIIEGRSVIAKLSRSFSEVNAAMNEGLREGGKELSQFIKYELLEGQLVKKRTGKLQRGIYYTVSKNKVTVRIRGEHAQVGNWIDQGLDKTWIITPRYAKRLVFRVGNGPNGGVLISTTKVQHPGIKARHFMRKAAEKKRNRVEQLVRARVRSVLLLQKHA